MKTSTPVALAAALFMAMPALAQDVPAVATGNRAYSPYPDENFPNRVFFGDTHLHSSYSSDAGMLGNTLGPEEAFRFARGETVTSSTGIPARLRRPLDFVVLTDHAENLGLAPALKESNPLILKSEWGRQQHALVRQGTLDGLIQAFQNWLARVSANDDPTRDVPELKREMWQKITTAAEKYNDPGRFTALIGFEWTSQPGGSNLHRNVVFRDGKQHADQIVPLSSYDTQDPEQLWAWLDAYEKKTGGRAMAIAHNGNLSNGVMFDDVTFSRKPLDRAYAQTRMRWEPVYEVTQMKGDGETHPVLSPTDEFANFERWDKVGIGSQPKSPDMLPREYARQALKSGLAHEARLGANPFKFGMIGAIDSHTSRRPTRTTSSARWWRSNRRPIRYASTRSCSGAAVRRATRSTPGRRAHRGWPACGRARTRARRSGTRWRARRCTPRPAPACSCVSSRGSTSRPPTCSAPTSRATATRRGCRWAGTSRALLPARPRCC